MLLLWLLLSVAGEREIGELREARDDERARENERAFEVLVGSNGKIAQARCTGPFLIRSN